MIVADARRILELLEQIDALEEICTQIAEGSELAGRIDSIPGFGRISSAELAGEIGTLERFPTEASLALYVGMACLSQQSGQHSRGRAPRQVNRRAKAALMIALARHIEQVPQSKAYYDRKRAEGKQRNQALRALGRHRIRVLWAMVRHQRNYDVRTPTALPQTDLTHDEKRTLAA
jgi:transposase